MTRFEDWITVPDFDYSVSLTPLESTAEYNLYDVTLETDKYQVELYQVEPVGNGTYPAIHFIHWLETKAENSNRTQFLPIAKDLAAAGIISILPDCFWSIDKTRFEEEPEFFTVNWWKTDVDNDLSIIKTQLLKLKLVEKYLLSLENVDSTNMGLGAHDFGAMFACLLASIGYKYKVYAFMAMTSHFSDWFRFGSKLNKEQLQPYIEQLEFTAPINHISSITSPLFLAFATDDFYVPKEVASKIYNAASEPKKLTWYEADHGMNSEAFDDLKSWLVSHLKD